MEYSWPPHRYARPTKNYAATKHSCLVHKYLIMILEKSYCMCNMHIFKASLMFASIAGRLPALVPYQSFGTHNHCNISLAGTNHQMKGEFIVGC